MKRVLYAAGALMILCAPAFADEVTIEKRTITHETVPPESGSTVSTVVLAPTAPPAPQIETAPPAPAPTAVWQEGHWSWNPERQLYVWMHGHYAEPPRVHAAWLPGRFVERPGGWVWEEGHWAE
ncbi:MAG: YXWGXW repeat-containing protein [Alphaproteobacteria bacterium]|nr:YXWGXW repeat-containing protein [Alphaproteobacteria bacterium]